jgi:uncharacterized protein DUF1801
MTTTPPQLRDLLLRYDPAVQSLAVGLRQVVLEELSPCHEYILSMPSKVVAVYSSSVKALADGICCVAIFRSHVTLVFYHGVDLTDRHGWLRGSGKVMRHIRVERPADLERPALRAYLRQARRLSGLRNVRRSPPEAVITRVKNAGAARKTRRPQWPRLF